MIIPNPTPKLELCTDRNFVAIIPSMPVLVQPGLPEDYRINTSVYEGPLDLLLTLIDKAELDITRLALAQVTDQYLAYLENIEI